MRPCRIEARALKEADDWLEEYRRLWEERLDRLDDYLRILQTQSNDGKNEQDDHSKPRKRNKQRKREKQRGGKK